MKKVYFYVYDDDVAYGPFESLEMMLKNIDDCDLADEKEDLQYFEAVEGEYVPPSTPETVRFPE